jgi:protein ImuA
VAFLPPRNRTGVTEDLFPAPPPPCAGAANGVARLAAAAGGRTEEVAEPCQAPEALHPALWRADQLGHQRAATAGTGFPALDAELPGGGWPTHGLTELLLTHAGIGEVRLLAPALAAVQRSGRHVMLFDPPAAPAGWVWAALGITPEQLVIVQARGGAGTVARQRLPAAADVLWALEHALKSGEVGAVLAWMPPTLRAEALRRLQLAAQAHDGPAFLLREAAARERPSAAPLRLWLRPSGADELVVHIVKRRGPPLGSPLRLALAPVLPESLRGRAAHAVLAGAPARGAAARA